MEMQLGERIDNLRREKNISIDEIAEVIGTKKRNVYDLLKRNDLLLSQLSRLCELLDCDFFELYKPAVLKSKARTQKMGEPSVERNMRTINFSLKYPADDTEALQKFMTAADVMASDMGLELG